MKLEKDRVSIFIGYLSITLLWPYFTFRLLNCFGIWMRTLICYEDKTYPNQWYPYGKNFVICFLGFGVGFTWKHTDNPNMQNYDYINQINYQ